MLRLLARPMAAADTLLPLGRLAGLRADSSNCLCSRGKLLAHAPLLRLSHLLLKLGDLVFLIPRLACCLALLILLLALLLPAGQQQIAAGKHRKALC